MSRPAKVVRLDDRRPEQDRRDNQTIAVYEQPLTDWSKPTDPSAEQPNRK